MPEHAAPVAEAVVEEQALRGVARERDRRDALAAALVVRSPADQHRQLHRRQILRLVDEQVRERVLRAAQQLAGAQQDRDVVGVEDRQVVVGGQAVDAGRAAHVLIVVAVVVALAVTGPFHPAHALGQIAVHRALTRLVLEPHRRPVHLRRRRLDAHRPLAGLSARPPRRPSPPSRGSRASTAATRSVMIRVRLEHVLLAQRHLRGVAQQREQAPAIGQQVGPQLHRRARNALAAIARGEHARARGAARGGS